MVAAVPATAAIAASPASGPVYWTTGLARQALLPGPEGGNGASWYVTPTNSVAQVSWRNYPEVLTAKCSGIGQAHDGGFSGFSCSITWKSTSDATGTVYTQQLWVRLWPSQSSAVTSPVPCVTNKTFVAYCPPAPTGAMLPGDPRAQLGYAASSYMSGRAATLTLAKLRAGGLPSVANLLCSPIAAFAQRCTWGAPDLPPADVGSSTVRWIEGKTSWTTTITVARTA